MYLLAKLGFDTAENEPTKIWQTLLANAERCIFAAGVLACVQLLSDAGGQRPKSTAGMAGVVIFDPEDKVSRWRFSSAAVPESIIAQFEDREQYVG